MSHMTNTHRDAIGDIAADLEANARLHLRLAVQAARDAGLAVDVAIRS